MDSEASTPARPPDAFDDDVHPGVPSDDHGHDDDELEPPLLPYVSWPPPGLERLHGDLWTVTTQLGAGGVVFTLPLLAAATARQDFWSLGLFGEAWWILVITSLVGLFRFLRRWARTTERGYRLATVALVLGDRRRDAGFLLQGARFYSEIPRRRRTGILRIRLLGATLLFAASLWLSAGFVAGVLLATRGILGPTALAWWTLGPVGATILVAVVLHAWESGHLRRARRAWFNQPWSQDLERGEIAEWHESLGRRGDSVQVPPGSDRRGTELRLAAAGSALLGLGVGGVGIVLMGMAGIGPMLATIAIPKFSMTHERAVRAEAVTEHQLPADADVTPLMAGEALLALTHVGAGAGDRREDLQKPPVRTYEQPFFDRSEAGAGPTGVRPVEWASALVPRLDGGLEPAALDYLEEVGSHPALAELRTLARAEAMDEAGATLVMPLPPDVTVFSLPLPRFSGVREAAYAHVGGAIAAAARGRDEEAVTRLREVISAGLLLGRDGNTLLTNLIGYVVVSVGAEALANLYEATGREIEARALRDELETTRKVTEMLRVGEGSSSAATLLGMPEVVVHPEAIRGLRWESFIMLNGLGPCINLNRSVFGTDEAFDRWIDEARDVLVRYPADEEIFALSREGFFAQTGATDLGVPGRLVAFVLGDPVAGGCAAAFTDVVR